MRSPEACPATRRTVIGMAASMVASRALAAHASASEDVAAVRVHCESIVARFYGRLSQLGVSHEPPPAIKIAYTAARTSYDPKQRLITAPAWSQAPPALRAQVELWSGLSGGEESARSLFSEIYNGFMIAHEATHAFQADLGFWNPRADLFLSEIVANRGALAFALETPAATAHAKRLMRVAAKALPAYASPVPAGESERDFFNANYAAILSDARLHAWFEARMMLIAWSKRDALDFATMMTRLRQAAALAA